MPGGSSIRVSTTRETQPDERSGAERDPARSGVATSPPGRSTLPRLAHPGFHGRSPNTQRAYRADVARFRRGAGKPLPCVTLTDLQAFADSLFELAAASRYRILSARSEEHTS